MKNDKTSIFGFANDGNTKFEFQGKSMESQDIGNHHFGVIIAANKLLPREFALKMAGSYQISSGTSRSEWQRYLEYDVISPTTGIIVHMRVMLPPYGDDPRDQNWIKAGYNYFDSILKKKMR